MSTGLSDLPETPPPSPDPAALLRAVEAIVGEDARFMERFYALFFERRPDTRPLFGVHAESEREEMLRETIRSLVALAEEEPWLDGNLMALGRSHAEYGVEAEMYESFARTFLDCANESADGPLDDAAAQALEAGIREVSRRMLAGVS